MAHVVIQDQTFDLRSARMDDMPFIFSTWMESARQLRNTRMSIFNSHYPDLVRRLMSSEAAFVLASPASDALHAWACGRSPNLLHFAYVPHKLRGYTFGRAVISAVLKDYPKTVFVTSSPLSQPNHTRFIYNPFVLPLPST